LTNKQGILLLAFLFAAAPAFADSTSGHSKGGSANVAFSEGFFSQQDSPGNSAQCNFLFGSPKQNGLSGSSIAGGSSTEISSGGNSPKLLDFSSNQGASSDKDKVKEKHHGGPADGTASGSGLTSPVFAVQEPASQTLLLFGLACLGMLFYQRKTFANAI